MALPKKGTRIISINDTTYRWMVTGNDMVIDVIIVQDQIKGQKLLGAFDYHNEITLKNMATQNTQVTPEIIRKLIVLALKSGWEPGALGKPDFRVSCEDTASIIV